VYNLIVITKYKFRCYPHASQRRLLARTFGCVRYVYNHFLKIRSESSSPNGESVGYAASDRQLTQLKKTSDASFLNDVSAVPLQQVLRHLQSAFVNFFDGRSKYPKFKKKTHRQSAKFSKRAFTYRNGVLSVAKIGKLKVRWSRDIPHGVNPSSITVSRSPSGKYFVGLTLELPDPDPLQENSKSVGVDLGISTLATLSNGETVENPKHTNRNAKRLARLQRSLCRRRRPKGQRQSNRYMRLKRQIARVHERIADARKDTMDKLTHRLVKENGRIGIEDLSVRGMLKNHKLARAISDAGFGMFRRMLEYKAKRAGRTVVVVSRFFPSSQLCSHCGHRYSALKLGESRWTCAGCGTAHDRDVNAAKNLLAQAVGHTVSARGGTVRPAVEAKAKAKGTSRRTVNRQLRKE
jgi:putative transposase